MKPINFPNKPPVGQKYPDPAIPGLPQWQWNGSTWIEIDGSGGGGGGDGVPEAPIDQNQYVRCQAAWEPLDEYLPDPVPGPPGPAGPQGPQGPAGAPQTPSDTVPLVDGTAAPGTSVLYSRGDHVHPTDPTRAPLASPVFTGNPQAPTPATNDNDTSLATTQFVQTAIATGVVRANVVINGDFRINQTGYVSGAVLAAGSYGHDQWKAGAAGGDYSFTQLKSSTQITIASGKSLIQPIEDVFVAGGSYILTWTGTAQARAGVNTLTPSGSYAASPLLITGQTAGTVMSVEFNSGTLGTVKLEIGATATPFVMRPYDQELLTCKRYLYKLTFGNSQYVATLQAVSTTAATGLMWNHPVEMRVAPPGLFLSSNAHFSLQLASGGGAVVTGPSVGATATSLFAILINAGGGGLVAGNATAMYSNTAGSWFEADARL